MADNKVERVLLHVRGSNPMGRFKNLAKQVGQQNQLSKLSRLGYCRLAKLGNTVAEANVSQFSRP